MINNAEHWMEVAGAAVDALLVLRVLQLRLQKTYMFITLACVLALGFDGVALWLGAESREMGRFFIYSRFLYAFVYPAAAFDVWEEVQAQVGRLRKVALLRLVASLVLAAVLGLIIASVASGEESPEDTALASFAVIVWAASATASLAFLWSMHRLTRAGKIELPHNTAVWLLYFQLALAAEVLTCFLTIIWRGFSPFATTAIDISLGLYGILITLWCVWKLRARKPSQVPSTPENSVL